MAIAGSLVATASIQTDAFRAGAQRMVVELRNVRTAADQTTSTLSGLGGSFAGLAGGAISLAAIAGGLREVIRVGTEFERLRGSLTAITGSAQLGRQEFAFVAEAANRLGLGLQELGTSYRSLLAATRGTELAGQDTRQLFTALTQASRAYGLSTEETGRALQAFQQIIGKGKVSQEELRQQLAEALPGASQIAARAYGVTTAELDKLIEKGISATEFTRKFTAQLNKEVPAATEVVGSGFVRLGNEIDRLKDRIAQSGIMGFFDRAAGFLAKSLQGSREAGEEQQKEAFRSARTALGGDPLKLQKEEAERLLAVSEKLTNAEIELQKLRETPINVNDSLVRAEKIRQERFFQAEIAALQKEQQEIASASKKRQQQEERMQDVENEGARAAQSLFETSQAQREAAKKAEHERTLGRFNEIANRTEQQAEREKKAEEDAAAIAKKGADDRVQLLREVSNIQQRYLEGLQEERDRLVLTRSEIERKVLAGQPLEPQQRKQAEALLDEIQLRRTLTEQMTELFQRNQDRQREEEARQEELAAIAREREAEADKKFQRDERERLKDLREETGRFADFFTESILSATEIGKRGFSSFVDSVAADLQRLLVRQYLAPALSGLIQQGIQVGIGLFAGTGEISGGGGGVGIESGGGIGSFPTRARGGPVFPGMPFIVGEQGPELFVPDEAGTIVPNGRSMGAAEINLNFYGPTDTPGILRSQGEIRAGIARAYQGAVASV